MPERIDLVNEHGAVTTPNISRDEYNQNRADYPGEYMQIVLVLGVNTLGHVLVHQRSAHKTVDKNKIDKICETVQAGESPALAAVRGMNEEAALAVTADKLVLARAGINEYERHRTLYGIILNNGEEPRVNDPKEVAWVRFIPVDELIKAAQDATMQFVDGFFTDAATALEALYVHSATPAALKDLLATSLAHLNDHIAPTA